MQYEMFDIIKKATTNRTLEAPNYDYLLPSKILTCRLV